MRNLGLSSPILFALGGALVGCVEPVEGTAFFDSGTGMPTEDSGTPPLGEECPVPDQTRLCECTGGQGTQVCLSSMVWSNCDCSRVNPRDSGIVNNNPCKAGYYTGSFEGTYWSGVFDFGLGSVFPVDIKATGANGQPGLALTIDEEVEGADTEFPIYKVGDGCVVGTAQALGGIGGDHPFVATLEGELECATGNFNGVIKGYYYLFGIPEIKYNFQGPISARYRSDEPPIFSDAVWTVQEHMMTSNPPGGSGTWTATYSSPDSPPLPQECVDLLSGGGGTNTGGDAGT